jgi:hypothetical protein
MIVSKRPNTIKGSVKKSRVVRAKNANRSKSGKLKLVNGDIQYVLPLGNGWVVKSNNAVRFTIITDSKREAITVAREIATRRRGELVIHGKDGKIQDRQSYA